MRFDRVGSICLATVLLAGCGKGEVYDRPPEQVRDLLRTVEVPLYVFGSSADTDAVLDSSDPAKMVWNISANGSRVMKVVATLAPEGSAKTRVIVDVEGATAASSAMSRTASKSFPGSRTCISSPCAKRSIRRSTGGRSTSPPPTRR